MEFGLEVGRQKKEEAIALDAEDVHGGGGGCHE